MAEMSIFRKRSNPLFEAAMAKSKSLRLVMELGFKPDLIQNKFFRIIENDPKSPLIMGMGENRHLIYYPENSTPYLHQYETSIKFVEILDGEIWDELTEKKFSQGDKFKIYPGDNIKPYTKNNECYVRVCVNKIDDIWSNVCK